MDLCLEPHSQDGAWKHSRKEKVRLACLTTTHHNVPEVSELKTTLMIRHFKVTGNVF